MKIVGISGVGKTTLIEALLSKYPHFAHLSFGHYLATYGMRATGAMRSALREAKGLVIMDEHLEFGDGDLVEVYREENTIGIFLMEVDPVNLLLRRRTDTSRIRSQDEDALLRDQGISRTRALHIAVELSVPIMVVQDGAREENLKVLNSFIEALGGV